MKPYLRILSIFGGVVLRVVPYIASYHYVVQPPPRALNPGPDWPRDPPTVRALPLYRGETHVGELKWLGRFYAPAHALDRQLRPDRWKLATLDSP